MNNGGTLKQMAREEFWAALDAYKAALTSNDNAAIVATSVRVHAALGVDGVPKSCGKLVRDAFRSAGMPS